MKEDYLYKTPDTFRLIRILFGILLGVFITGIILIYVLEVNEVSKADAGILIASDKPKEYFATSSLEIEKLYVQEGSSVQIGDTIAQLLNNKVLGELYKQRNAIQIEEQRIKGLLSNIEWNKQQIAQTRTNKSKLAASQSSNKVSKSIALENLMDQMDAARTNVALLKSRLDLENQLLKKGAISAIDYQKKQQQYFQERNDLLRLEGRYDQQKQELDNIGSDQDRDLGKQNLSLLNLQAELQEKEKLIEETELSLFQKRQVEVALLTEIENFTIISEVNGYITALFNQVADINRIERGRLIARVTPDGSSKYYCKLMIGEEALRDVVPGQVVNIKLDAYNHYQYGVLKGRVINIDKEVVDKMTQFYVLASVDDYDDNVFRLKDGYKISGEVILGTIKLNQYISRKIFKKMNM